MRRELFIVCLLAILTTFLTACQALPLSLGDIFKDDSRAEETTTEPATENHADEGEKTQIETTEEPEPETDVASETKEDSANTDEDEASDKSDGINVEEPAEDIVEITPESVYQMETEADITALITTGKATPEEFAQVYTIDYYDPVFERINGRSYQDNPNIGIESLRYLRIPHYDYNHNIKLGEMIVNSYISYDVISIFLTLFQNEYEIESIRLIDDFWTGDGLSSDDESIANNNTSAFCYRNIAGGWGLSNHAYGLAIDVNPKQNPYYYIENGEYVDLFDWDWDYLDRSNGMPHMILKGDICESTFASYGFIWGGDWSNPVDYQHFER